MKKYTALLIALMMSISMMGTAFASSYETEVEYGVNFRSAPSTDSHVIRMLPKKADIHVIEKVNKYWLKIKTQDGTTGFISSNPKFTDYTGSSSNRANDKIVTTGYPWLRSAPDVNNSKIYRSVPKGTELNILEKPNDYYVKVNYNGQTGYISTHYIRPVSGSGNASPDPAGSGSHSSKADDIIATAKSLMGRAEYDFGTRDRNRLIFDCSSFTEYVFEKNGISLKWGTRFQKNAGQYVSKSNLRKGDLVFFSVGSSSEIGHVGIYISDGNFINILDKKESDVHIANLNSGYWERHYVTARRVIE